MIFTCTGVSLPMTLISTILNWVQTVIHADSSGDLYAGFLAVLLLYRFFYYAAWPFANIISMFCLTIYPGMNYFAASRHVWTVCTSLTQSAGYGIRGYPISHVLRNVLSVLMIPVNQENWGNHRHLSLYKIFFMNSKRMIPIVSFYPHFPCCIVLHGVILRNFPSDRM